MKQNPKGKGIVTMKEYQRKPQSVKSKISQTRKKQWKKKQFIKVVDADQLKEVAE